MLGRKYAALPPELWEQLPYTVDDGEAIGDSDTITAHLTRKSRLKIDDGLFARAEADQHRRRYLWTSSPGLRPKARHRRAWTESAPN
jgi:hypothetical protein